MRKNCSSKSLPIVNVCSRCISSNRPYGLTDCFYGKQSIFFKHCHIYSQRDRCLYQKTEGTSKRSFESLCRVSGAIALFYANIAVMDSGDNETYNTAVITLHSVTGKNMVKFEEKMDDSYGMEIHSQSDNIKN